MGVTYSLWVGDSRASRYHVWMTAHLKEKKPTRGFFMEVTVRRGGLNIVLTIGAARLRKAWN